MRFVLLSLMTWLSLGMLALGQGPDDFEVETYLTGLEVPWDMNFAEDGSLYYTERIGRLTRVSEQKKILATANTFSDLRVEGEGGLMGMALDPDFINNRYLFVCYSAWDNEERINRVVRYTETPENLTDEQVILDKLPGSGAHNGCRLAFGPDGFLYISTGDAFRQDEAQDSTYLGGKILRIAKDGSIPGDNPYANAVWSLGHRNPQGLAFDQEGRLFVTEHGPEKNDELNLIQKGGNYGWPAVTGNSANEDFIQPLQSYYSNSTIAIAGLDIYEGDLFPWQGNLLFVSLKAGRFYRLELNADGSFAQDEILLDRNENSSFGRLRDVEVAPDGSVYLATSNINDRNNNPDPSDDRIIRLLPKR